MQGNLKAFSGTLSFTPHLTAPLLHWRPQNTHQTAGAGLLSLADQKGTELTKKRRGKKGKHASRFHSAALEVLAIIYIWAQSGGIKSSDPCKVTRWAIRYFASKYWL